MTKRRTVIISGALGVGVVACRSTHLSTVSEAKVSTAPQGKPTLTSQATEGPYYFDASKVRSDITEGMPGIPLDVVLKVIDENGTVLPNARIDIWHCNASGFYSGYAGQGDDLKTDMKGKTFLRGTQNTDATGYVRFQTIYPGWYRGRTTHIHFKVIVSDKQVLISQFFLPDALSEFLYNEVPAYKRTQVRDTLNTIDRIALDAGESVRGTIREANGRYTVFLEVAVDKKATPTIGDRPPVPGNGKRQPPLGAPPDGDPDARTTLQGDKRIAALVPKVLVDNYKP